MRLGMGEVLIVLVVVLLVFGPNKLPQLGDSLGKGIRNFKKAMNHDDPTEAVVENVQPPQLQAYRSVGTEPVAPTTSKKA